MLRALVRWPAPFARSQTPPDPNTIVPSDRLARRVVAAAWAGAFALLLVFVSKSVSRVPYLDEYYNVHLLADPLGVPLRFYWAQHNEHRIPLPRVLFVAAVKLAGNDFRGPPVMNALLLALTSAVLVRAVARVRGRYEYTDAFLPLIVMNVGQWENLMWGFQVQFVSSSVLALLMLALVIGRRFADSPVRVAAAGAVTLLVTLCGANGVALAPAFACLLLAVGVRSFKARKWVPGLFAVGFGLAGFGMIALYFHGLQPVGHHSSAKSWATVAENAANFLGIGFGSVAATVHGPSAPGVAGYALGVLVLLGLTAGLLAAHLRTAEHRPAAVGVGCVIGAVLSLGLGLAYGRGAMGGILACNRYTTLAMPLAAAVYVAWAVLPSRLGRMVPALLLLVALAGLWSNAASAFAVGAAHRQELGRTEVEIRRGIPLTFVVDRHFGPGEREFQQKTFAALQRQGIEPFRDLVPDPPLHETPIPVQVVRAEGLDVSDGNYRVTGEKGFLVLALPRSQRVYGFKLTYEAVAPPTGSLLNLVSWEPGGAYPPRPGYAMINHLHPTTSGPAVVHVFADRETDTLRIDLGNPGSAVRVVGLGVLTTR